jgi:hypothetical protein
MSKVSFHAAYAAKQVFAQSMLVAGGDVVGVGIGPLDPRDPGRGPGLVVYTKKHLSTATLTALARDVTVTVGGHTVAVPVRIEQSGEFKSQTHRGDRLTRFTADPEYSKRVRPVPGGYSVGRPPSPGIGVETGTAGLIVLDAATQTQYYILSNNHILNKDNSTGYTETVQAGPADGGGSPGDTIGRLDSFIPLAPGDNYLDAAICIPDSNDLVEPLYGRNRLTVAKWYTQVSSGWNVFKAGRTSGDVTGIIDSINTDVNDDFGGYGGLGSITLKEQCIIKGTQISLPGDSGSVWLRQDDCFGVAVNCAATDSGDHSVAFPLQWAMDKLQCIVAAPGFAAGERYQLPQDDPFSLTFAVAPGGPEPQKARKTAEPC